MSTELTPDNIYNNYAEKLKKYFYTCTTNFNLSSELSHDTLTKAILNLDKYEKLENISFDKWLFTIAKNTILDHHKKIKFEPLDIDQFDHISSYDEYKFIDREEMDFIIYNNFNENEIELIKLYFYEGYKPSDIAKMYNVNNTSILNKIYKIKKKLKEIPSSFNYTTTEAYR